MSSETPGKLLSAARESQSLSQADIAKQTRLPVQTIDDIENDKYDHFGAATFVRGYLRNYARVVGVSEEKILTALAASNATVKLTSPAPLVIDGITAADNTHHHITSYAPSRTVMVIGALVMLSAIVWWENQGTTTPSPSQSVAVAPVPVVAKTEPVVQPETVATVTTVAAKKTKHTVVAHHHAEPMHVTYTLKPVSPEELASNH